MNHPKASPFSRVEQEVGLSKITVEYSRPSAKGRDLFGKQPNGKSALVPYGRIWRVGANESTKITFSEDILITDQLLSKGTYALYAFPEENEWHVIFHNNTTHWGDGRTNYNPDEDALRILVVPSFTQDFQESFLISFDGLDHNGTAMNLNWGTTQVSIPMYFDTKSIMQLQIVEQLSNSPSAQTYYEIARYYHEQRIHQEKALGYVERAIENAGDTYYFYRVKSLILADLSRYDEAIKAAEISLKLAEIDSKDEFVRLNQNTIRNLKTLQKNK
jgi:tetratricopeptide (TPR) repeat protein